MGEQRRLVGTLSMTLALCCYLFLILFPSIVVCANSDETSADASEEHEVSTCSSITDGWKKSGKNTYYYVNGEMQTGWCKIQKSYYFFSKKGVLQKNKIVGDKKSGYYYVDKNGIRSSDKNIKLAVEFVMKNSAASQSSKHRLKSCFKALCRYSYKRFYTNQPSAKNIKSYASYMFKKKEGNCYRYASAFAYISRVLGYDSRVSVGGVTAYKNHDLSPHGWCEVKIDNKWMICDCSMQRAHSENLFLVQMNKYPFRIKCEDTYTMTVKNGKVKWK